MDSFVLETSSGKLCIMLYYKRPATDPCIRDEARLAALSARCVFLFSFPNDRSLSKYPRPLLYHVAPYPRSRSRSCLTKNLPSPSSSSTIIFSKLLSSLREIDVSRYVVSNKLLTRYSIRNGGCDVMVKNIKARARIVERFLIQDLEVELNGEGRRKRRPKTLGRLSTRMQERWKEDRAREEGTTRKRIGRAA